MTWYGLTEEERFKSKLRTAGACLLWTGSKNDNGYGLFGKYVGKKWKQVAAHRLAYQMGKGAIPDGLFVLHRCDNPACVNPDHLFLGTQSDNMKDMIRKGRSLRNGSRNNRAKLDDWDVIAIRHDRRPARVIAADYIVSKSTIDQIRQRKSWTHIPELPL